jgi:hypothetical protein
VDNEYDEVKSRTTIMNAVEGKATEASISGPEKNAALLLMNLSVRDTGVRRKGKEGGTISETSSPVDVAFPRVKRPRANSM